MWRHDAGRARQLAALPRVESDDPITLVAIDIVRFKTIVSCYGGQFGVALLNEIRCLLDRNLRQGKIVSRSICSHFMIAWPANDAVTDATRVRELLRTISRTPIALNGETVFFQARAGFSSGLANSRDQRQKLEADALVALNDSEARRVEVAAFEVDLRRSAEHRLELEASLCNAIAHDELELHYQPRLSISGGVLLGAEALLRWRNSRDFEIAPTEFVPILEDTGMIHEVGRWARAEALATAIRWRQQGHVGLRISVNVSALELVHPTFVSECEALLSCGVEDQMLDFEVTESALMENLPESASVINRLRGLGCRVEIDDFGTGFSSIGHLAHLPVDGIKIDRKLIANVDRDLKTSSVVANIVRLAKDLSMTVVAEGVESGSQVATLRRLGCDVAQGFYFGAASSSSDFFER